MDTPKPAGSCPHRPTSNGYSYSRGLTGVLTHGPVAWCGHCRAYVTMDAEWIAKYKTKHPNSVTEFPA